MASSSELTNAFFNPIAGSQTWDPRVMYDYYGTTAHPGGHWIITCDSNSITGPPYHQYYYVAVSTSNPDTLPLTFNVFALDMPAIGPPGSSSGDTTFFDFGDEGMGPNNWYLTGNYFDNQTGAFLGGSILILNKDALENSTSVPAEIANGGPGTLTPPFVRQQGATGIDYFIYNEPFSSDAAIPSDSDIGFFAVSGTPPSASLAGPKQQAVTYYDYPPYAQQPGTFYNLDTLDTRFLDKTTQEGSHVYPTHTVDSAGLPTVRFYVEDCKALFAGSTPTLLAQHDVYSSPTSNDFDSSISANDREQMMVTLNETLVARSGPTAQEDVRFSFWEAGEFFGGDALDAWAAANQKGALVTGSVSPSYSYVFRNGDHSSTVVDPSNDRIFWGVAQNQLDTGHVNWNTWLFDVFFPTP